MVKLIALFRKPAANPAGTPADTAAFDSHYHDVHLPLIRKMPGLRKLEVTKITGAPIGETKFHVMAEMYFDSADALNASSASPEGKAAARDLMSFAADTVMLFIGEVAE